jgi:photosystem II stability/assembly factor-like uncharacterized protein
MGTGNGTASARYSGVDPNATYVTRGVLYRSEDGGVTWEELPTGLLPGLKATNAFVDPQDARHVVLLTFARWTVSATERGVAGAQWGPMESRDGGATWTPLGDGLPEDWRAVSHGWASADLRHMYLETQNASFASRGYFTLDGGATWNASATYSVVAYDPHDVTGSHLYAVSGGGGTTTAPPSLEESFDGGATWTRVSTWPEGTRADRLWHFTKLVPHPTDPAVLFVAGHGGTVQRSDDGGRTWSTLLDLAKIDALPATRT